MRELKEEEVKKVSAKLRRYIGNNIESLLNPSYVLLLNKQRVFYSNKELYKQTGPLARDSLVSIGICLGRFTKGDNFILKITCLPVLMTYCVDKVKVKPTAEMHFVYGNHIQKTHLLKIGPEIKKNVGVLITTSNGIPLGFGITSKSGTEVVGGDSSSVVVIRQGDTGEYLREEQALM